MPVASIFSTPFPALRLVARNLHQKDIMKKQDLLRAIATFAVMLLSACSHQAGPEVRPAEKAPSSDAPARTESVTMERVHVDRVLAPGRVEANANRLSHVVLPLTGRVVAVQVRMGDFVQQGAPLLTLESAEADAAVSTSVQTEGLLQQAQATLAKGLTDLERQKALFASGAVPEKEVINAQALATQMQAAVEQARAAAEQARRRLQLLGLAARGFGQRVTIPAPISGRVLETSIVAGEIRNDLSAPVMTIADLSSVWVATDVPETAFRFVRLGEAVRIQLTAFPGEVFLGRVALIGDGVDPQTRTIKVRVVLPNPGGRLKPDMFGAIELADRFEPRPTVPVSAVVDLDGNTTVWRERQPAAYERVVVKTGKRTGDRIAILSGLTAGDRVVVDGKKQLAATY